MIEFDILAGKSGEAVKSGPIGLAVILVLCVAVYFLFKSMSKHLKKVRDEFPSDPADEARPADPSAPDPASSQPDQAESDQAPEADPARRSDPSP